jgi:hypothetical protein
LINSLNNVTINLLNHFYLLAAVDAAAGLVSAAGVAGADAVDAADSATGAGTLAADAGELAGSEAACSAEAAPVCAPASPCISILSPALKIKNKAIAAKTKKPTSAFHILLSLLLNFTNNSFKKRAIQIRFEKKGMCRSKSHSFSSFARY